jgi:predicted RNase H-like HicB family nuclease
MDDMEHEEDDSYPTPEFLEHVTKEWDVKDPHHIGAVQDKDSGKYMVMYRVPSISLEDGHTPQVFATFDDKRYVAVFPDELIQSIVEDLLEQGDSEEEVNEAMMEWLGKWVPTLMNQIDSLPPLRVE